MIGLIHGTVIRLSPDDSMSVLFPGRSNWPHQSVGYVRCPSAARASWRVTSNAGVPEGATWRDYADEVRTHRSDPQVIGEPGHARLIVGARNCLNEFGYEMRLEGQWYRRSCDAPLPVEWPVLQNSKSGACLRRLGEAENCPGDIVCGLPLVIHGQPVSRQFLIANCSDPAHVWHVHPTGVFGPPSPASAELAEERWNAAAERLDEAAAANRIEAVARRHSAMISDRLLHSVLAQCEDGSLLLVAMTGAMHLIARWLVRQYRVRDAITLENSGSVSWAYRSPKDEEAVLVGAANQRHSGTVFLRFQLRTYLATLPHFDLDDESF